MRGDCCGNSDWEIAANVCFWLEPAAEGLSSECPLLPITARHRVISRPDHATLNEFQRKLRIDFRAGRGTMGAMTERTTSLPVHDDERWRAVLARDGRFDGAFVYAVRSTGVFCHPSCPSRRPRRPQVTFIQAMHGSVVTPPGQGAGERSRASARAIGRVRHRQ